MESDIIEANNLIPKALRLSPIPRKYMITWSCQDPKKLFFLREIRCKECSLQTVCSRFPTTNAYIESLEQLLLWLV